MVLIAELMSPRDPLVRLVKTQRFDVFVLVRVHYEVL